MAEAPAFYVGIDIGGTFTDVVLDGPPGVGPFLAKTLTTPDDPVRGVITGLLSAIEQSGAEPGQIARAVHGTTLATNLILERRGARVAFVTTEGFADMFQIGQRVRPETELFNMNYRRPEPLLPRSMVVEVPERMDVDGHPHRPLDLSAGAWLDELRALQPEAIAVSLLHACTNPAHEQEVFKVLAREFPDCYLAVSSDIWPELGEYERSVATVVSAYVGPTFASYVRRLAADLDRRGVPAGLEIMTSSGGIMPGEDIARRAVHSLESGPAAGVVASKHLGEVCGIADLISFDMGGTTAKASVIRGGEPEITRDFRVGADISGAGHVGEPLRVPIVDLAEVGAGGGSIAWVDRGGMLQVGPRSVGANPGPACYGLGGEEPTVTDANVVLGYLGPDAALGGQLRIDASLSRRAIEARIAEPLGLSVSEAALAIHDLVNAKMGSAIRMVTIRRGIDPRDFCAVGFGGAGPAHIVRVAQYFGIPKVIVPLSPGVRSAFGLLVSDVAFDYIRTRLMPGSLGGGSSGAADTDVIERLFGEMEAEGRQALLAAGQAEADMQMQRVVGVRLRHQRHELSVPVSSSASGADVVVEADAGFRDQYERLFGLRPTEPTQLVTFRVRATGSPTKPAVSAYPVRPGTGEEARVGSRPAYFEEHGDYVDTPVYDRSLLRAGDTFAGPAIVEELDATSVCPPGYDVEIDRFLNMHITPAG